MGRGNSNQARQLLYGNKPRGSGPSPVVSATSEIDALLAKAPYLPDDLADEEHVFGDQRYDAAWLERFAKQAMISDGFSDTAVEERIVDEIERGAQSSFTARAWARPFKGEEIYQEMIKEGQAMKEVIDLYQPSDLPVNRATLQTAWRRLALKVALSRCLDGDDHYDHFHWMERQALRNLVDQGGATRLGIQVPAAIL